MADFELNVKINGLEQSVTSIGQLEKAISDTKKELEGVQTGTKEFKFLENQAKNLDKVMVALSGDAKTLNTSLKDINATAGVLNNSLQSTVEVSQEIGVGTGVKTLNENIKVASTSSQSLRTELRKITLELQGLEPGSARFQELSLRAGQLRDTIADTSGVIGSLAGTGVERLGKALSTTAQIGVAGFQGIAAAQALFGSENEELNKTLIKLTALLNLSQAITTFGGLGDKITELKAGFTSLFPAAAASATAITATAVAEEGEAIASTEAAVATSGFALALNALPLVAIVTALGLVVAGLISYVSAESQAEKAQKKRTAALKAQNEAEKEQRKQIAGQSAEYVLQIKTLAATNKGSAERKKLIKEINDTYNTTLQNLSDEKQFQKQLNLEVANYIAYQKARFQLDKNAKAVQLNLEKQAEIQSRIAKFTKDNAASQAFNASEIARLSKLQDPLGLAGLKGKQDDYSKSLAKLNAELAAAEKRLESYGKINKNVGDIIREIEGENGKYVEGLEKTTKGLEKSKTATELYDETLKGLLEFEAKTDAEEEKFAKKRVERTEDKLDDLEFERDIVLAKIIQEYTAQKKAIEDNVKDETERKRLLAILEVNLAQRTKIVNSELYEQLETDQKARVENQKKVIDDLILAEKILKDEITFGNKNTNDSLISLQIRRNQTNIEILENELLGFEKIELTKTELLEQNLELQSKLEREKAEAERFFQITEILNYYKSLKQFNIDFNDETGVATVKVNEKYLTQQFENNKKYLEGKKKEGLISEEDLSSQLIVLNAETVDKIATEAEKTEVVINKSAVNLTEEANVKKLESDAKYNKAKVDLSKKADTELVDNIKTTVDKINEIFGLFANQLSGLFSAITESNQIALDQQLSDTQKFYDDKNIKIQNSYDAEKKALNQNLTNGAISQEQYNAAISNLDIDRTAFIKNNETQLNAELLSQRQKAFDKEKKLKKAQAAISGFQGALTAFTSAFQLGPIAGPVVGAILAGLVVATTAKQIQNINNTKLDGGGGGGSLTDTSSSSTPVIAAGSSLPSGGGFTTFSEGAGSPGGFVPSTPFTGTPNNNQRVYVVESDITAAQNRVRVLEDNSTFG